MSPALAAAIAQMHAYVAKIEGMKAENSHRESCGLGISYDEDAFLEVARDLETLSQHMLGLPV